MGFFRRAFITSITGLAQSRVSNIVNGNPALVEKMEREGRTKLSFVEMREITSKVYAQKRIPAKKVQVFYNVKKDIGSTTMCHQVSTMMALLGFKVLVIDCDPQADITNLLGVRDPNNLKTLFDVIECGAGIEKTIHPLYEGYDIIPADLPMVKLESILSNKIAKETVLSTLIAPLKERYDFIFIDTSPAIGVLNANVLFSADVVNVVCELTNAGIRAANLLVREIEDFSKASSRYTHYNIIANKYDPLSTVSRDLLSALKQTYQEKVLETTVRECSDFNTAKRNKEPVFFSHSMKSKAVQDTVALTHEIILLSSLVPNKSFKKAA